VEAAHALLQDQSYSAVELVNPIIYAGAGGPVVRCFYVSRDDAVAGRPFNFVAHEVMDDDHPLLQPRSVPTAAAEPQSLSATTSEGSRGPSGSRTALSLGLASLLVVLLLGGVMVVRGARDRMSAGVTSGAVVQTTGASVTATLEIVPTDPDRQAATTSEATASATSATSPVVAVTAPPAAGQPSALALPTPDPTLAPTAAATVVQAQTAVPAAAYLLRAEAMAAATRSAFLVRAAQAGCSQCYNVDLVGPEPYTELRIRVDGGNRTLRTFDEPSLVQLLPRAEPYTLQVIDLQGNPLSEPLTLNVAAGEYYILRVAPVGT
jgi:hypothetical protein